MAQYAFGAGLLWGTPLTDATGSSIAVPTPLLFGTVQDVSVDISFENKMLYGNLQFPVAIGRGKGKITGKSKIAAINGAMWNSFIFGQTMTNGIVAANYDTVGSAIPATPYQITVVPPSSGTFTRDLGVISAAGVPLTRVAALPATGQYTVSIAGLYTFAAADTLAKVFINYEYTASSTTAKKSTVANLPMGYAPTFRMDVSMPYSGKILTLSMYSCIAGKLGVSAKNDDFTVPDMDFEAFADASGNVLTWSTSE